MQRAIPVLLVAMLLGGCVIVVPPAEPTIPDEEYQVYAALIEGMFINEGVSQIVINDQTAAITADEGTGGGPDAWLRQQPPDIVPADIAGDFARKNKQTYRLARNLPLALPYTLIPEPEVQEFFQDTSGWDRFYEKYPGAQGIMTLSRVGFSPDGQRAVVYVGNQQNWLAGEGQYVLLRRAGGAWGVVEAYLTWVS